MQVPWAGPWFRSRIFVVPGNLLFTDAVSKAVNSQYPSHITHNSDIDGCQTSEDAWDSGHTHKHCCIASTAMIAATNMIINPFQLRGHLAFSAVCSG